MQNRETTLRNPGVPTGLTLLTTALMLGALGCKKPEPTALPPPVVQVMETVTTNVTRSIEFIGQLDSPQNVEVRARVEAFVQEVLFTEGTNVVQGQPLFRLDEQPFEQRLATANGMLAEAKAALNKYETPEALKDSFVVRPFQGPVARIAVSGRRAVRPAGATRRTAP